MDGKDGLRSLEGSPSRFEGGQLAAARQPDDVRSAEVVRLGDSLDILLHSMFHADHDRLGEWLLFVSGHEGEVGLTGKDV
jgi:hypothetical protein